MNEVQVGEFEFPGDATRREYAVYLVAAVRKATKKIEAIYVGKTGDNRDGCNPIISRIGNHLSHNRVHSQLRNKLINADEYDFRVWYAYFGKYISTKESRDGVDVVNEMERELIRRAHAAFGDLVLNPKPKERPTHVRVEER